MKPRPAVSIVMVVFGGGWSWVPRALETLKQNTTEPYEVIVVDNGGADDRPLPAEAGVELLRNDENAGFGPGSNQGVERARADVVCLLNPDVLVGPGWLPPLLERLADNRVGAVFPAKLNLDGTMQEAGALVTGDAHTFAFGRGEDPDAPEHSFRRLVDFGSAACMCLTRRRFASVKGFDPAYRLAYYEDADLCFRLRQLGLRLVYEPRSRVGHARTVSADPAELHDVYAANREVFLERWRPTIETRPGSDELRGNTRTRLAARDLHAHPRVLLVDDADSQARAVAARIASDDPAALVTLLAKEVDDPAQRCLLDSGVEVVCTERAGAWLNERFDHYTHVVSSDRESWLALNSVISATQPGANIDDLARVQDARVRSP